MIQSSFLSRHFLSHTSPTEGEIRRGTVLNCVCSRFLSLRLTSPRSEVEFRREPVRNESITLSDIKLSPVLEISHYIRALQLPHPMQYTGRHLLQIHNREGSFGWTQVILASLMINLLCIQHGTLPSRPFSTSAERIQLERRQV
jgi:hypothetical protein